MTDGWLDPSELRIGLGCMRLSTDKVRDDDRAIATIGAAVEAGITVFDTARSYGDNEQLVARALRLARATDRARVVTKGGMTRAGGAWVPDGRAKAIRADCETSLDALGGVKIDLYLLHVPDPRTPWRTSVRALARLVDEGLVRRVGVANVNRHQLDEALELAPIAAVQVALSVFDDSAVRGGVVERCEDAGVAVIAHSPLGGPRRAGRMHRRPDLLELAEQHGATPAEAALAWLLELSPAIVPIPGARRPETARSAARAAHLRLEPRRKAAPAARVRADGDLVLVMGIPGAGKTRIAESYVERGYLRLNRDERGGTLRGIADALEEELASGVRRVVLDNTYLSRASRSYVVEAAGRHGVAVRCVWLDTPLAQAQVNLVERLLELFGSLPTPEELKELAKREPGVHVPTTQMRALRELEQPSTDEGLTSVEHVAFERTPPASPGRVGVFVGAAALQQPGWERAIEQADPSAPHLLFDWRPDADAAALDDAARLLAATVSGPVESALCPHAAGPPRCWCRPPLPGLPLAFAHTHGVDVSRSILVGTSPAHRTLAKALGTRFVQA